MVWMYNFFYLASTRHLPADSGLAAACEALGLVEHSPAEGSPVDPF